MTFERTTDYGLVREIITHPQLYRRLTDDFSPKAEEFHPAEHDSVWYVLVKDGTEVLGLFMFVSENGVCLQVHTCLLPNSWGDRAKAAARGAAGWIWENTTAQRIITHVPRYNRLAFRLAEAAGMKVFGVNERSFMKDGKLHDQILLGMSRPEGK